MASKQCILCGTKPPPALTGEHIWSDWYNRKDPTRRYLVEATYDGKVTMRKAQSLNLKPKVLCEKCNSVWGSDLETAVEPIFTPMLTGDSRRLSLSALRLIVTWFTLKSMAAEYLVPQPIFYSAGEGAHLLATSQPPPHTCVWIGRYFGPRRDAGWIMNQGGAHLIPHEFPVGILWASTTYSIGQVLLHLFDFKGPVALRARDVKDPGQTLRFQLPWAPANWLEGLTPIWPLPLRSVPWPPEAAFDDEGFEYLAKRWNHLQPPPNAVEALEDSEGDEKYQPPTKP